MKKLYSNFDHFHADIYALAGEHGQLGSVTIYKTSVFFGTEFVADYSIDKKDGAVRATFTPKYVPLEEMA